MATRVNTKFIGIMLVILFAAATAVAGLWYMHSRGDAERLAQQGEALYAQGDYRGAASAYSRAARRDPANIEYLRSLEAAILAQVPQTSQAAAELYRQWLNVLVREAQYRASLPESHLRLIEEQYRTARLLRRVGDGGAGRNVWREIATAANQMLERVPQGEADRELGLLYRGLATIEQRPTSETERERAEQDLLDFVEARPEHDLGWAALVRAQMILAEQAQLSGHARSITDRHARLHEVAQQAVQAASDGPETAYVYADYLLRRSRGEFGGEAVAVSELQEAIDALVDGIERTQGREAQWLVLDAVDLLQAARGGEGLDEAAQLIESYIEREPLAVMHQYTLGNVYYRTRQFEAAENIFEEIITAPPLPVSLTSQMQSSFRQAAVGMLADVEFQRWTQAPDDADRVEAMREAAQRLEQYVSDPENDPRMIRTSGHLALMESRYHEAAAAFDRLIREGATDPDIISGSAFSLYRIGEVGLALQRATRAVDAHGDNVPPAILMLKGEIEFRLGRFDAAGRSIAAYRALMPDDDQAALLEQAIAARSTGVPVAERGDDPLTPSLQAAQHAITEGDLDTARATLQSLHSMHPQDIRPLAMLAQVAMQGGETELAIEYISHALEIDPAHQLLRQWDAIARSDNIVDATIVFFRSVEDEAERLALVLSSLSALREQLSETRDRRVQDTQFDVEETEAMLAYATEQLSNTRQELHELDPANVTLIEFDFNEAIRQQNWSAANEVVQRARRANADRMNGLYFEGRFEMERRPARYEHAVRAFQSAVELRPFSNVAWRALARAYERVGNFREAVSAFEQAHTINPNDVRTIRGYLRVLMQTGDHAAAMRVARDAVRVTPGNVDLRELWLELESEQGNHQTVFRERMALYSTNPGDRLNASRLALQLARVEPRYDLLLESDGSPVFTERRWNQMTASEQRRSLDEARVYWRRESQRIVDELEARHGLDLDLALLRATLMRLGGDAAGGERYLREYIEQQDQPTVRSILALANFQSELGQITTAMETMRWAAEYQNPETRDADLVLADYLFARNQFEQARELYESVYEVAPTQSVGLRLVDCAVNLQEFDEAERLLSQIRVEDDEYTVEMLRAMIARGRAENLIREDRRSEAERYLEQYRAALETAARLNPSNPGPHVARAQGLLWQYRQRRQRVLLEDALAALARAEQVRAGDIQTMLVRVEIHREAGNTRAAISELTRLLERQPNHLQARRSLMQLHVDQGNINAARDLILEAIELYPTMPVWHELLGNVYAASTPPDRTAAAAAYRKAYELSNSTAMLQQEVAQLMVPPSPNARPDFARVLRLLQNESEAIERDPVLEAIYARVLHETGRTDESAERLRRSYVRFREHMASNDSQPGEIGDWYQRVVPIFAAKPATEVEGYINDFTNGSPDEYDLLWIGRSIVASGSSSANMARAAEMMRRAVRHEGAGELFRTNVRFELSGIEIMLGEHQAAAQSLEQVIADTPEHWVALNNLAFLKTDYLNDPSGALVLGQRALELQPDNASVLDTVGWTYYRLGEYDRAEEYLLRSLEAAEAARTTLHLAHVLSATGRFDAALARLRRAAELNPDAQTQSDIDLLADDIRTKRAQAQ